MDEYTDEWVPPTESEMKVIEARRERSNKISQLMGQYLLKGYKMLASSCDACETILLQDRQQKLYCVACSEVDSEHTKDNPALSGTAAQRQLKESEHRHVNESPTPEPSSPPVQEQLVPQQKDPYSVDTRMREASTSGDSVQQLPSASSEWYQMSCTSLKNTIRWASRELQLSRCPEKSTQYCQLLKLCAESLVALRNAEGVELTTSP